MEAKADNPDINSNNMDTPTIDITKKNIRRFCDDEFMRDYLSLLRHDLRSPMNSILGFSGLLASRINDPDLKKMAETVIGAGNKLIHRFNDFSDLSCIGLSNALSTNISLKRLMLENRQIFSDRAEEKKVRIRTESVKDIFVKVNSPAFIRLIVYKAVKYAVSECAEGNMFFYASHDQRDEYKGLESASSENSKEKATASEAPKKAVVGITYFVSETPDTVDPIEIDEKSQQTDLKNIGEIESLLKYIGGETTINKEENLKTISIYFPIIHIDASMGYVGIKDQENVSFEPAKPVIADFLKQPKKEYDIQKKEIHMVKDEEIINEKNIPYLPEILELMETELYPEWEQVSKSRIIDDIQSFASTIRDTAIKYDLTSLSVYGNSLLDQAKKFDMKNLPKTLNRFPEELERLRTIYDKSSKSAPMKALIAEDNEMNRLLLERLLTDMGFQVESVSNGEDALTAFRREKFTVIIIDAYMPEKNGVETIITMRKEEEESGDVYTPIIAVTGVDTESERMRFLEVGADDLIIKPFSMELLNRVLWDHIKPEDSPEDTDAENAAEGINETKALERAYGKKELLDDFFKLFNKNIDTVLNDIDDAFDRNDFSMLRTMSHRLKGSLIAVGADTTAETARQMELISRNVLNNEETPSEDDIKKLKELMEELNDGCTTVKETINKLLETNV